MQKRFWSTPKTLPRGSPPRGRGRGRDRNRSLPGVSGCLLVSAASWTGNWVVLVLSIAVLVLEAIALLSSTSTSTSTSTSRIVGVYRCPPQTTSPNIRRLALVPPGVRFKLMFRRASWLQGPEPRAQGPARSRADLRPVKTRWQRERFPARLMFAPDWALCSEPWALSQGSFLKTSV